MHTLTALGEALLIGYLPGALIFRLPIANRSRRALLSAEERTYWALILSLTLALLITLTLAAAGRYSFGRLLLLESIGSGVLVAVGRGRLFYRGSASRFGRTLLVPLALIGIGTWLYFPPAEYVMGGKDPGTYINEGIQIAQRGTLMPPDSVIASVPASDRNLFFPSHRNPTYYGLRFMGFFIMNPDDGTVVGQFPHLYPAAIALGYGLDGLTGARRTSGVWAIIGLLSVYFAAVRLLGRPAAAGGTVLLAVNVVQVWFARYPNSEVVMQALVFGALLANARAQIDDDDFFAPVAALLLGGLLFLRFDAILAVVGLLSGAVLGLVARRRMSWRLIAPLGAFMAVWWFYLNHWMTPYAAYPIGYLQRLGWSGVGMISLAGAALVGLRDLVRRRTASVGALTLLPRILTDLMIVAAFYAYFLRQAEGRTAIHDAAALRVYAWYVTPLGLLAGFTGLVTFMRRRFWRDPALFLTAAIFGGFFFYKIRIVPEHFWMARRFLPVILPVTALFAAHAAIEIGRWVASRLMRLSALRSRPAGVRAAGGVVAACGIAWLGLAYVKAVTPIRHHVEYAGLIPRLETLAARFGDRDLLIVESRNASDTHVLALPLAYVYAKNVLVLNSPRPNNALLRHFLEWARTRYSEIFFVGGSGTDLLSRSIGATMVYGDRFQVPEYESLRNTYPRAVRMKEFEFGVYRFVLRLRRPAGWISLDIGGQDDLNVVRFHAKELKGPYSFRWTRDFSYISIVDIQADTRLLTLWLGDGGRPPEVEPAHLTVSLDDRPLGRVDVVGDIHAYSFMIPDDVAGAASRRDESARLRLEANTWNPRAALGTPDDRNLGVMVDRVEVR